MKTTRPDLAPLVAATLRRYRRGEIGERAARIEAALVKALVDVLPANDTDAKTWDVNMALRLATDEELAVLERAQEIVNRLRERLAGERT